MKVSANLPRVLLLKEESADRFPLCALRFRFSVNQQFLLRPTQGNALSAFAPYALRIPHPELVYSTPEKIERQDTYSLPLRAYIPGASTNDRGLYSLTIVSPISPVASNRVLT